MVFYVLRLYELSSRTFVVVFCRHINTSTGKKNDKKWNFWRTQAALNVIYSYQTKSPDGCYANNITAFLLALRRLHYPLWGTAQCLYCFDKSYFNIGLKASSLRNLCWAERKYFIILPGPSNRITSEWPGSQNIARLCFRFSCWKYG